MTGTAEQSQPRQAAFVDEHGVAARIGISINTLRCWRLERNGPPFHRFGRLVRYRTEDLESWAEGNRVATNDA